MSTNACIINAAIEDNLAALFEGPELCIGTGD